MCSSASDSHQVVRDRIKLDRKVQLRFDKFQDFLSEVAGNISPGGMFVRSDEPQAAGERFEFECSLADGYPLVSGRAEVVWIRERSDSEARPNGMGVRFLELRDRSEMLIRKIVEQRLEDGKRPFRLDAERPRPKQAQERETAASPPEPRGPAAPPSAAVPVKPSPSPARGASAPPDPGPVTLPPKSPPPAGVAPPPPRSAVSTPTRAPKPLGSPKPRVSVPAAAISSLAPSVDPGPESRPLTAPPRPAAASVSRPPRKRLDARRFVELLLFSIVVGAFMVLVFHQYWFRPQIERLDARLDQLTGSSRVGGPPGFAGARGESKGRTGESGESVGSRQAAEGPPDPLVVEDAQSEPDLAAQAPAQSIQETVQGWARAWSEQRVEDYLAYYAPNFVPAAGSRREWQERRRERLSAQGAIRVAVVSFQIEETSASEARVAFTQSYQSNAYRDRVRKNQRLVRVGDAWKIAEEVVIRQLPW